MKFEVIITSPPCIVRSRIVLGKFLEAINVLDANLTVLHLNDIRCSNKFIIAEVGNLEYTIDSYDGEQLRLGGTHGSARLAVIVSGIQLNKQSLFGTHEQIYKIVEILDIESSASKSSAVSMVQHAISKVSDNAELNRDAFIVTISHRKIIGIIPIKGIKDIEERMTMGRLVDTLQEIVDELVEIKEAIAELNDKVDGVSNSIVDIDDMSELAEAVEDLSSKLDDMELV